MMMGHDAQLTAKRTLPYFHKEILPLVKQGKNVLVAAHGNSLRLVWPALIF
jgi:2,3-bisphosphoglycerate-dependent phosphoglycerate mutase